MHPLETEVKGGDLELVRKCQAGCRDSFDGLIIKYQRVIFNLAYRFLGDYEEASDLTQEVFIKAYRSIKRFRSDANFSTWLYRICANLCKNKLRHWKRTGHFRQKPLGEWIPTPSPNPGEAVERKELEEIIQKGIGRLSNPYRLVLVLRDLQDFSYEEIAKILRCSQGTVKSRLARARMMLREELKEIKPEFSEVRDEL